MNDNKIRVRFAPSPTGYLHVGGVRTALYNYIFARHNSGDFILRIEDTDKARSTEESIKQITDGMKWLGLDWDEGPFRQTDNQDLYLEHIERLLNEGKAYRCVCTPDELDQKRKRAMIEGRKPKYDGTCREKSINRDQPHVIRFRSSDVGVTRFNDLVRGEVSVDNSEIDDLIILRSDGTPTYNLCVVIDDVTMGMTHIIRGDDHLSNTPRQVQLFEAFGYTPPQFAHISMVLGPDKSRLSKRHGAASILEYKNMGYLPEALINYIVRLGWSHGDQEIFSKDELIEHFTLDHVSKSAAVFNTEKLQWLNAHYIKNASALRLASLLRPFLEKGGLLTDPSLSDEKIAIGIPSLQERSKTLIEMMEGIRYYLSEEITYDEKAANKFLTKESLPLLDKLTDLITTKEGLDSKTLEAIFQQVSVEFNVKLGKIAQPVRVALTGKKVSPGIFDVVEVLGREKTLRRLKTAREWIENQPLKNG